MNEKKDLDRLFQEKFKDFEVAPPEFVWENIQEILQEKKKRRVIPIWFKLSGVAALLILSGLLATLFFNDTDNPVNANPVVIDKNTTSPADALKASPHAVPANAAIPTANGSENSSTTTSGLSGNTNNTAVATADDNGNIPTNAAENRTGNSSANRNINTNTRINTTTLPSANNNNAVANQNTPIKNNRKTTGKVNTIKQAEAVVYETAQQSTANGATQSINITKDSNSNLKNENTNNAVAAAKLRNDARNFAANPSTKQDKANSNSIPAQIANEEIAVAVTSKANESSETNSIKADETAVKNNATINDTSSQGIAANGTEKTQGTNSVNAENNATNRSSAIIDKNIPQTEAVAQTAVDTTATAAPVNELEKLLQEKLNGNKDDDKALAENKPKERWVLKPQVAPVFYNSLSSGSPINEQFAANSKSYDNDLSFGLGINYAVTERITIRSGINSVNLSYATNDIAFYPSLNSATSNIGSSKTANIVVQNGSDVPGVVMIDGQPTQAVSGSMLQKTGYIEIPLEMSYSVVNKKFGIDVIGGVSSLFLNQNNVSVVSNTGLSTQVGEAQNLNNLHFSTNIGLGFKYHFWDSFQVNFEPMFKYQLNAYSENSGNFKPYFIGLYSGVSFSF